MFSADFFKRNRQALLDELGGGALVALPGHTLMQKAADSAYKFTQDANFWYLSGIDWPDWWLIFCGRPEHCWLVCPEENQQRDWFDGSLSPAQALKISGAQTVIDQTEARQLLAKLKSSHNLIYTITAATAKDRYGSYGMALNPVFKKFEEVLSQFEIMDVDKALRKLRAIKQPAEIKALQQAADISVAGIDAALKKLPKLNYEYEFEAILNSEFKRQNADHAYDPIVAAGQNGCVLHYQANDSKFKAGDWLLFDAAATKNHYNADITRTVPLHKPKNWQLELYAAVLKTQQYAISLCRPGQSVKSYLELTDQKLAEELLNLKIIKKPIELRQVFPHAISHGLGIDVHEGLGGYETFQAGMVLTVEPGVYLKNQKFAVRLEDDILITNTGPKNLTAALTTEL